MRESAAASHINMPAFGSETLSEEARGLMVSLLFLSIQLDTEKLEVWLPEDKMCRLGQLLSEWKQRHTCIKRELLSLLGILHHACQVVCPGCTFLRQMIELSKVIKHPHHHIRLNTEFRTDLEWWILFLPSWNGVGNWVC